MSNDEYRNTLQRLEQDSQRSYDKTLITLCSGGLVLSITYLSQLSDARHRWVIFFAWIAWCISLTLMLFSFTVSVHSMRKGQDQLDSKEPPTGGRWAKAIVPLNWLAGVLLIVGIVLMLFFAGVNQGGNQDAEEKTRTGTQAKTSSEALNREATTEYAVWNAVP